MVKIFILEDSDERIKLFVEALESGEADYRIAKDVDAGVLPVAEKDRLVVEARPAKGAEAFAPSEVQEVAHARNVLPLRYPKDLMSYHIPGEVVVRFIVDPSGHARPGSVQVLSSTHPSFTRTVLETLRAAVFDPARVGGVAVPQVVEQPFTFSFREPR